MNIMAVGPGTPVSLPADVRPVVTWLRAVLVAALAGALAGLVVGGVGSRIAMRIVALMAGREHYGELTEFEFRVGEITLDGTISLLFSGAFSGVAGGLTWLAVRYWLNPLRRWRGLVFGALLLVTVGFETIDEGNFDFTRFGSPAINIVLFAALFIAFGLLVAPLADWLERTLPSVGPAGPLTVGRTMRSGALGIGVLFSMLIGILMYLFLIASNALYGIPVVVLLIVALVLPRQSRWPAIALLALVAVGAVGTLLSIGNILADAYR